jgi:hypothetical protein
MKKKTSKVWDMPKDEFQRLLDTSNSVVEVIKHFGLNPQSGNHKTIYARVKQEHLSLTKLRANREKAMVDHAKQLNAQRLPNKDVFCEHSNYNRKHLKSRIIDQNLIIYQCEDCGIIDEYNGKPISLQLDHKNGVSNDNRIENLRFLCPNCHSQTPTFGKKRFKKEKCYETIEERNQRIAKYRKFNPTKGELEIAVRDFSLAKVGRMYGVCDASIKKRCKLLGINWRD